MPYVDLNTIHNPATGTIAPASWGDQTRDNLEFLIDPPVCSVLNNTTQSVTTGVATSLTANTENFDNDAMHSTVTNTSRITVNTAGRYLFIATVLFAANATGTRQLSFRLDNTTNLGGQAVSTAATGSTRLCAPLTIALTAGQFVEVQVVQSSGGNLNVTLEEFAAMFLTR